MQNSSKPSYLVPRSPSIDRRYRPRPEKRHNVNLFNLICEEEDDLNIESNVSEDFATASENSELIIKSNESSNLVDAALVYLRMRPIENETISSNYSILDNILITSQTENSKIIEKHFTFSDIFISSVEQKEIYEKCIQHKINTEENFTIMTYGTSGSGKTYTLLGDLENPGILPRAIEHIFTLYAKNINSNPICRITNGNINCENDEDAKNSLLKSKKMLGNCNDIKNIYLRVKDKILSENDFKVMFDDNFSVFIWISFVEIYNEIVYDLLSTEDQQNQKRNPLRIISNDGKVFLKNINSIFVKSGIEAYKLLTYGLKRNTYASTAVNSNSSRSHCIFFIDLITFNSKQDLIHTSYKFCDLAGSERLTKTGNIGDRLKEAQRINTSLMVLGRCLNAACNNLTKKGQDMIPYRESKLTMLLQASLLGKEKLSMIVNITPTERYYEENLGVLGFSSIAKNMIYKTVMPKPKMPRFSWFANAIDGKPNYDNKYDALLEENIFLLDENKRLSELVEDLQIQSEKLEDDLRNELVDQFEKDLERRNIQWENQIALKEKNLKEIYEAKYKSMKRYYENKLNDQDDEINDEETIDLTNDNQIDTNTKKRRLENDI